MIYLASPYSHADAHVRRNRFRLACAAAAQLFAAGRHVFSPIAHTHPIAELRALPTDWAYWEAYDRKMLGVCTELKILTLEGWEDSKGVQAELTIARELGLPVSYMSAEEALA